MIFSIGNREFSIETPKIGQIEQVAVWLAELGLATSEISVELLLQKASETGKLTELLAIAVTEKGKALKDKDIFELIDLFQWEVSWDQFLEYLTPFFACIFNARVREVVRRELSIALSRVLSAFAQSFDGSTPVSPKETPSDTPPFAGK